MAVAEQGDAGAAYGQYCPVARALEVLGERWALLIMRDLTVGTTRFNDLARGLPGLSRTLLAKRLRQLERAGLVEHVGPRYLLTEAGVALRPVIFGLAEWGAAWAFDDPRPEELDAELLAWWIHNRLDTSGLPGQIHVVHLHFLDDRRRYWIVIERGDPSVCLSDPGFDIQLTLTATVADLYAVWLGRLSLPAALRSGALRADGDRAATGRLSSVLLLSPVAGIVRDAQPA